MNDNLEYLTFHSPKNHELPDVNKLLYSPNFNSTEKNKYDICNDNLIRPESKSYILQTIDSDNIIDDFIKVDNSSDIINNKHKNKATKNLQEIDKDVIDNLKY